MSNPESSPAARGVLVARPLPILPTSLIPGDASAGGAKGAAERPAEHDGSEERAPGWRPLVVGLTGSIGSGKSTVARLLAERGAYVIDADDLARQATEDPKVLERIAAELGDGLVVDGRLDREAMADLVFADPSARTTLNSIVHPWVGMRRLQLQSEAMELTDPPPLIVHDVPLLFEVGLDDAVDATVVVAAPLALRAERVRRRSGLPLADVKARDAAQMPEEEKVARADFVIDNAGDLESLERAVARLWPELLARRATR